jgi:hypothetical protein
VRNVILRAWLVFAVAAVLAATVGAAPGCGLNETIFEVCPHPVVGRMYMGQPDPCCIVDPCPGVCVFDPCPDAGDAAAKDADDEQAMTDAEAGPICPGACVPLPPGGWSSPVLVWQGPASDLPAACPDEAPFVELEAYAGLVPPSPASCGACGCAPPDGGTCSLPSTVSAASAGCGDGGTATPFDPPPAWDGGCTAPAPIDAGAECNGAPCVQSLTVGMLAVTGESCVPSTAVPTSPTPPLSWTTGFLACAGSVDLGACGDQAMLVCVSPSEPPSPYKRCVYQFGDQTCPDGYPETQAQSFWTGAADTRACTPCTCGAPSGSLCTAELSVFTDGACSSQALLSDPISSLAAPCFDLTPPGLALGSMSVDKVAYDPGTCAFTGGQPTGTGTPTGLVTLCCAP